VELEVQGVHPLPDVHQVARIANAVYGDFEGQALVLEIGEQAGRRGARNPMGGPSCSRISTVRSRDRRECCGDARKDSSGKWCSEGGTEVTNPSSVRCADRRGR
jgi:hypothetical protein